MKPINHNERKSAIWKFMFSLIPVVVFLSLFIYLFCVTANHHAQFIKEKYDYQRETFAKQAVYNERIDSVIALLDFVRNNESSPNELLTRKLEVSETIQESLRDLKNTKEHDPYKYILEGLNANIKVQDSIREIHENLKKTRKDLKICKNYYDKGTRNN